MRTASTDPLAIALADLVIEELLGEKLTLHVDEVRPLG
jgi:hypothetical protein